MPMWSLRLCGRYWVNTPTVNAAVDTVAQGEVDDAELSANGTAGSCPLFRGTVSRASLPPARIMAIVLIGVLPVLVGGGPMRTT